MRENNPDVTHHQNLFRSFLVKRTAQTSQKPGHRKAPEIEAFLWGMDDPKEGLPKQAFIRFASHGEFKNASIHDLLMGDVRTG